MTLILNGTDNSATVPAVQGGTAGTSTGPYFPATNQWAVATNGTQAMLVDSSQNVGIGTASPTQKLDVNGNVNIPADNFYYLGGASDRYIRYRSSQNDVLYSGFSGLFYKQDVAGVYHAWFTGNNERMRIDSSGNLLVGTTSTNSARINSTFDSNASNGGLFLQDTRTGSAGGVAVYFKRDTSIVGNISTTNTATAYNTSSDYRLKQDIAPMTGALDRVVALKPVTYKWKSDGADAEGFIAHELAEVCPHAVTGEKDAVDEDGNPRYQGIDVSFLVATLTAAIQELKAEFDAYKATHP